MMSITTVGDSDFEEKVLKSELPVLVIFTANWTAPGRAAVATLEELAPNYSGKINMYKLDVDESPNVSSHFGIRAAPTTLIFKNGQQITTQVGDAPKAKFQAFIDATL